MENKITRLLIDGICFVLGSLLFACSVNIFTAPNGIAPGGITGAATLIREVSGAPIGVMSIVLNVPLFIWGIRARSAKSMLKSAVAVALVSVAIDLTAPLLPVYQGDGMLVAIFGGVLSGAGLALIFLRGGTTGGTDLAASLLARRVPHIPVGQLLILIDMPIVLLSAIVFHSIESPMYAIIVIYLTSKVIDGVLYGADSGKLLYVVSSENERIKREILLLPRGVTELYARGSYTGRNFEVLLVAVRRAEVYRVRQIILAADPNAFVIAAEASQIMGEGFAPLLPKD